MENRQTINNVHFNRMFQESKEFMKKLNIDLKLPRITNRQVHRTNIKTSSVEEYFRISVFNALYDHVIDDLKDRFFK